MGLTTTIIIKKINQRLRDRFRRKKSRIQKKINSWRIDFEYKEQVIYLFLLLSAFLKKKKKICFCSKLKSQVSQAYFPFCYYDNDFLPQSLSPFRTHTFMPWIRTLKEKDGYFLGLPTTPSKPAPAQDNNTEIRSPSLVPLSLHHSHHEISPPSAPKYKEKATGWILSCVAWTNRTPPKPSPTKKTQIVPHKTTKILPARDSFVIKMSYFLIVISLNVSQIYWIFFKYFFSRGESVIFSIFPSHFSSPFTRTPRFSRKEVSVLSSRRATSASRALGTPVPSKLKILHNSMPWEQHWTYFI